MEKENELMNAIDTLDEATSCISSFVGTVLKEHLSKKDVLGELEQINVFIVVAKKQTKKHIEEEI